MMITESKPRSKQNVIILCSIYFRNHGKIPNSKCNFENGFFTCDLPEDTVLLVVKVKTKTGNHMLVEDTEKQTEKFRPWKKPTKGGKTSAKKLPGVLSPRKNDNSMTSHSGPCPSSPTEMEYKPWFFDEPECLSSNKENILPFKSITPSSLKNLSLEEGKTGNDTEAASWEASVTKDHHDHTQGKFSLPRQTWHIRTIGTWNGWWNHRHHWLCRETIKWKEVPSTHTKIRNMYNDPRTLPHTSGQVLPT